MERRVRDIELAVTDLARVTEHLLVSNARIKAPERTGLLHAIDRVRTLCDPTITDDDDPDDDPPAAAALAVGTSLAVPRGYFGVDGGDGVVRIYRTDGTLAYTMSRQSFDGLTAFLAGGAVESAADAREAA